MQKIQLQNVLEATKQTQVYDIVNAIRNSTLSLQNLPVATAENVVEWGTGLRANTQFMNDFANALVNRIGLVVFRHVALTNPLARFKKAHMGLGDTVEEIFTDMAKAHFFDSDSAEELLFKKELPDIHALYHKRNRAEYYAVTVTDVELNTAFTSWENLGSLFAQKISSLYNAAAVGEYEYMVLLLKNYYARGHFKVIDLGEESQLTPKMLVEKARSVASHMMLPQGSSKFNSLAVRTNTDPQNLTIFMTPETEASVDVNVLAAAFNMDKASFIGQRIILDDLGNNPEKPNEKIHMIICDSSLFVVHDMNNIMTEVYNPRGLYRTYFYHVHQILSTSRFANAVAITTGRTEPVTEVIVKPAITAVKPDVEYPFNVFVRTVDGMTYEVQQPTYRFINGDTLTPYEDDSLVKPGEDGVSLVFKATASTPKNLILIASVDIGDREIEGRAMITVKDKIQITK